MNSLDALATAAKEGTGMARGPSWQAESDLVAGHPLRLPPAPCASAYGTQPRIDQ
jgi:DNA-binding transcriptional LysR family regulator